MVVGGDEPLAGLLVGDRLEIGSSANSGSPGKYIWVIIRCVNSVPNNEKWMCAGRHALWWFFHGYGPGLIVVNR